MGNLDPEVEVRRLGWLRMEAPETRRPLEVLRLGWKLEIGGGLAIMWLSTGGEADPCWDCGGEGVAEVEEAAEEEVWPPLLPDEEEAGLFGMKVEY